MSDTRIGFDRAHEIAVDVLRRYEAEGGLPLVIVEGSTIADDRGWIFYWNTKSFVENGDDTDPIAGNAPIIVLRDGTVRHAPTAFTDAVSIFQWLSEHPACGSWPRS